MKGSEVTVNGYTMRLVTNALSQAVPKNVTLPLTLTVEEVEVSVPVDSSGTARFRIFIAGKSWAGVGEIEDRWVRVQGIGVDLDDLALEGLTDLEGIPEDRWL
jgi:hypothetical protein